MLCLSLALVLAGGFGAHLVQTDFGKVEVIGIKFTMDKGQWITADLFKPGSASASNQVPLVVVCPGFERSKETMGGFSIELARRGIAVITIDPYNQGASSSTMERHSTTKEGCGVVPVVEQICAATNDDYCFVDKSHLGAAGYSAGGNAVLQSAALFGARQAKALRHVRRDRTTTDGDFATARAENKLSAIFIGGYVLTLTNGTLSVLDANAGMDYASYDEGAFRTQNGNADMRTAPEALRLVNSALPDNKRISEVEIGRFYGEADQRTLRVVHNTKSIHPLLPYDPTFVTHLVDFFAAVFKLNPAIASSNQIWWLKELFTLVSLVGGLLFTVPFTALLLRLRIFKSLAQPVPPPLPRPTSRGKIIFGINFAVSAAVACFIFMPLAQATALLFPEASASQQTWWFPQRINNAILLWAVANGLFGLVLFSLDYRLFGKTNGIRPEMWGIRTSAKELGKTFVFALIVCAAFYVLVFADYGFFHADFRFIFVAASAAFPLKMLPVALEYLPLFFIFYLANSIRVNCASRIDGQKEWLNRLINGLGNSVGLLLILTIQYWHLARTGTVFWTDGWLYVNLLLGVIPMMFVLPYFSRVFFNMTGKVWLGPMITCPIFIMMMLTNNVCYIPLK